MRMKVSILVFILQSSSLLWADSSSICFRGDLPYFQNFDRITGTPTQKLLMMSSGCREVTKSPKILDGPGIGSTLFTFAVENFSLPLVGQAASAFSTLNGSPAQRRYKAALDQIRKNPNPMDRIRAVYELAASYQGNYDYKGGGLKFDTPGGNIDRAQRTGTSGVCRDFASLLQWSLMQVARHPSSVNGGLGPTDFSSEIKTGFVPGGGHAWVRINLPNHDARGAITGFNRFDIDTTWYPEQFSILFPRLSSLSAANREKLINQCRTVENCLRSLISISNSSSPDVSVRNRGAPAGSNSGRAGQAGPRAAPVRTSH
jgi:hypothetical protein